jgi:VWFA-related protein
LVLLGLILWASLARSQSSGWQDRQYRLAVDVNLVNVTATVYDESGKYLENLKAEDFRVIEDGLEQEISFFSHDRQAPISIGVLIDVSGSQHNRLQRALDTAREIAATLAGDDEMFIVTFNSAARLRQKFTGNPLEVLRSLTDIKCGGETAVYDAIAMGLSEIQAGRNPKKVLLMITDGFDTKSRINSAQAEELLKKIEVLAYAIGINEDPLVSKGTRYTNYYYMLNRLTAAAGGRVVRLPESGQNQPSPAKLLLEELHQQYTLSYYPAAGKATDWRNIEVRVSRPGARLRYRNGYRAR